MVDLLTVALSVIGGTGAGLASAGFLAKRLVDHRLGKDLERYKSELALRADGLKTELSIYAHEHTVALTRVDAQRAAAISRIFAMMRSWQRVTALLVVGCPIHEPTEQQTWDYTRDMAEASHEAGNKLLHQLTDEAIYLDENTYGRVAAAASEGVHAVARLLTEVRRSEVEQTQPAMVATIESLRRQVADHYQKTVVPLHQDVIRLFRRQLNQPRGD